MRYTRLLWNLLAMKRNEKKSREQMKELQEQKLRKMLAFAYENSPYYRRAFEAVGLDRRTVTTVSYTHLRQNSFLAPLPGATARCSPPGRPGSWNATLT